MNNKLFRIPSKAVLGGVCAGLAEYFNTDAALIRVILVLITFFSHGFLFWAYVIAWIALPVKNVWDTNSKTAYNEPTYNSPFGEMKTESNKIKGAVLIGLGLLFLLNEWLPNFDFGKFWPLLLIGAGGYIIFKDKLRQS